MDEVERDDVISTKVLYFRRPGSDGEMLQASVSEVVSPRFQCVTWPGALVFSSWMVANRVEVENKKILELGCGTALVGAMAALLGATLVSCTDRDNPTLLENVRRTVGIALNEETQRNVTVSAFDYTDYDDNRNPLRNESYDVIVAADLLYSAENFDDILFTIASLLAAAKDPASCSFLTAYQDRSPHRCLAAHLEKYSLIAEEMQSPDMDKGMVMELTDGGAKVEVATRAFSSIHLMRIRRASV